MVTNYELRLKARKALQGNWQVALLVMFIASLPSLISQVVSALQGDTLMAALLTQVSMGNTEIFSSPEGLMSLVKDQVGTGYLLRNVLSVLAWLVSSFLTLGMLNYLLRTLRAQDGFITTVFSRTSCFFKAIGLNLMIALKIILWALPGAVLMGVTLVLAMMWSGETSSVQAWLVLILMYASYAALIVPVVMAAFRYAMATTVMADHPDMGVMQAIGESKSIMAKRKFLLFTLELSFIGWALLLAVVDSALTYLIGAVLGSTVYMLLNLALQVYMQTSMCAFYEQYRVHEGDPLVAQGTVDDEAGGPL